MSKISPRLFLEIDNKFSKKAVSTNGDLPIEKFVNHVHNMPNSIDINYENITIIDLMSILWIDVHI